MPLTELVRPAPEHVASYQAALRRGWSPDNLRPEAALAELTALAADEAAFLAGFDDPEGRGPPLGMPDGTSRPRIPSIRRWIWDGREVCGSIGLRWQKGTAELPSHVLGHIGYAVVPWRRGEGIGKRALALMLHEARSRGLPHADLTCEVANLASARVIQANGGTLVGTFERPAVYGGGPALLWRIGL
ncbi:GNAT family N-acetyltransferase [Roseococcus sp. YIM B11640]|uniref:GNAT family N-acetyltransferase n=1 Tax=Roseococcus sp. YIM B11640 TaxID=3133973 RepID=UPI003C7ACEF0